VARTILENGACTAAELAGQLNLTQAAVRRHLDQLLDDGTVVAVDQRVYGTRGRGRPAKQFKITDLGRDRFDQQYDDLAAQALRFLAETQGEAAVLEFARRRVGFIELDYARVVADDPSLSPAQALARVFTDEGYAASVRHLPIVAALDDGVLNSPHPDSPDTHAQGAQLCQQHCPVSHVAHEFPQLCEAETEAIARVLGTHVQRLATIAHGDGVCTTCIPGSTGNQTSQGPVTVPASTTNGVTP
jgi:predicted ArsR family transcriptional regulator